MFNTLINRNTSVAEWRRIPWSDPDFSRRMLAEHLNQKHERASRRQVVIDQQVAWIHRKILNEQPATILDLGCGPGFYTGRLCALGHTCKGIDFSPASIDYAKEHYPAAAYVLGDMLECDFGCGLDLIMMVHGELSSFSVSDGQHLIQKAYAALNKGGKLLLEVHHYACVHWIGHSPRSWHTVEKGLFGDEPYLCLVESSFEIDHAVSDYYVYATESGEMQQYTTMLQAYADDDFRRLLNDFEHIQFYPALDGSPEMGDVFVIVAEK